MDRQDRYERVEPTGVHAWCREISEFSAYDTIVFFGVSDAPLDEPTAERYRQLIREVYKTAIEVEGIRTFVVEFTTPFGLLALKTLDECRKEQRRGFIYGLKGQDTVDSGCYLQLDAIGALQAFRERRIPVDYACCEHGLMRTDDTFFPEKVLYETDDYFGKLLAYKVQTALFELWQERRPDVTWNTFMKCVRKNKRLAEAVLEAEWRAVHGIPCSAYDDWGTAEESGASEQREPDVDEMPVLFHAPLAGSFVSHFEDQVMRAHMKHLGCSKEEYTLLTEQKPEILIRRFSLIRRCLRGIDAKALWLQDVPAYTAAREWVNRL